jgi:adenylosuccinate lyase
MPVWRGEGDFLTLLKNDPEVTARLSAAELEACFDLHYHFKHVDTIFARVFGAAGDQTQEGGLRGVIGRVRRALDREG